MRKSLTLCETLKIMQNVQHYTETDGLCEKLHNRIIPGVLPMPLFWGVRNMSKSRHFISIFQIMKLCCKIVRNILTHFTMNPLQHLYIDAWMLYFSNSCCIPKCIYAIPLERKLCKSVRFFCTQKCNRRVQLDCFVFTRLYRQLSILITSEEWQTWFVGNAVYIAKRQTDFRYESHPMICTTKLTRITNIHICSMEIK